MDALLKVHKQKEHSEAFHTTIPTQVASVALHLAQ